MDLGTIIGLVVAFGGVLVGLILEGGNIGEIMQPTAAMIVFGGTFGAVMISFPLKTFIQALKMFVKVFTDRAISHDQVISDMVRFSTRARREGILVLEEELPNIKDTFLKNGLSMAIDGVEPKEARETLSLELSYVEEDHSQIPKVWEAAGGYAPTVGIIGAVLGLIQVMKNLSDITAVGQGIAVAFVATIYGVGAANFIFLPSSGKIKIKLRREMVIKELMLEGICGILEGLNPKLLESRLRSFSAHEEGKGKDGGAKEGEE